MLRTLRQTDCMIDFAYPMLVFGLGYLVLGITGFGSALVVVPLLATYWPLNEVVALAILLDIPASILHGGLNLKQIKWKELARLVPGMAVGTFAGLWLLGELDKRWPLFILGCYVVFIGLRALLPRTMKVRPHTAAWAHPVGTLVGLIEVMFATAGPAVIAWLQGRLEDVAAVRATVPVVMVLAGAIAVAALWSNGQVDAEALRPRWLLGMPIALISVIMGNRLAAQISPLMMKRLLASLLAVSGLSLMQHMWV